MTQTAKRAILNQVRKIAIGNTNCGLKEIASDLLHTLNEKPSRIATGCFLSAGTVERVLNCEQKYKPQAETLERIFRYCNAEITFKHVKIKPEFTNKPKE